MPKHSVGSVGILLILLGVFLIPSGALSIWLGQSGVVINNAALHFGATTTDEINNGLIFLSIGVASLAIFVVLFFLKNDVLKVKLPHYP